jgi:archaellum component FlaG (FlaF/FlaG flagellin family)
VGSLADKAAIRGQAFGDQLTSEIRIVNDPGKVSTSPTLFYVKNTGETTMPTSTITTILDGAVIATTNTLLNGETTFRPGDVVELSYSGSVASGDHRVRVVMENGVYDEMEFRE